MLYDVVYTPCTSPVDQLSMVEVCQSQNITLQVENLALSLAVKGAYPVWALRDIVDHGLFGQAEASPSRCLDG